MRPTGMKAPFQKWRKLRILLATAATILASCGTSTATAKVDEASQSSSEASAASSGSEAAGSYQVGIDGCGINEGDVAGFGLVWYTPGASSEVKLSVLGCPESNAVDISNEDFKEEVVAIQAESNFRGWTRPGRENGVKVLFEGTYDGTAVAVNRLENALTLTPPDGLNKERTVTIVWPDREATWAEAVAYREGYSTQDVDDLSIFIGRERDVPQFSFRLDDEVEEVSFPSDAVLYVWSSRPLDFDGETDKYEFCDLQLTPEHRELGWFEDRITVSLTHLCVRGHEAE